MKNLRLILGASVIIIFVLLVVRACGVRDRFSVTQNWFSGASNAKLTGLKLEINGTIILVTEEKLLAQIDFSIKAKTKVFVGEGNWKCTAYPQINGKWAGEMEIACDSNQADVTIGIPIHLGISDFEYARLNVGSECSHALYRTISGAYSIKP